MTNSQKYDWGKFIRIKSDWLSTYFSSDEFTSDKKLVSRCYGIKFSGTQHRYGELINHISSQIDKFVYSKEEKKAFEKEGKIPYREAMEYFGDVEPNSDGKYGELILFMLVESILQAPMIAHKIKSAYGTDQVKGSDGLFIGEYNEFSAIFIGESKIMGKRSSGIDDALESVDRFHGKAGSDRYLKQDLIIAKNTISKDLSGDELDYIYDSLDTSTNTFKQNTLVHPILIMFDDSQISKIETTGKNNAEVEELFSDRIKKILPELNDLVKKKIGNDYPELKTIYLDFFFIPVKDVNKFRYDMFESIHKTPYRKKEGKTKK